MKTTSQDQEFQVRTAHATVKHLQCRAALLQLSKSETSKAYEAALGSGGGIPALE